MIVTTKNRSRMKIRIDGKEAIKNQYKQFSCYLSH